MLRASPEEEVQKLRDLGEYPPPNDIRKMIDIRLTRIREILAGLPDEPIPCGFFAIDVSKRRGWRGDTWRRWL